MNHKPKITAYYATFTHKQRGLPNIKVATTLLPKVIG